jgi:hypothetical protein
VFFPDAEGKGYYRFALPADVYNQVLNHIENDLTPEERIALIGDEWAGVRSNRDTVGDYLNFSAAVKEDASAAVLRTALESVRTIRERIAANEGERNAIDAWIICNFKPAYEPRTTLRKRLADQEGAPCNPLRRPRRRKRP